MFFLSFHTFVNWLQCKRRFWHFTSSLHRRSPVLSHKNQVKNVHMHITPGISLPELPKSIRRGSKRYNYTVNNPDWQWCSKTQTVFSFNASKSSLNNTIHTLKLARPFQRLSGPSNSSSKYRLCIFVSFPSTIHPVALYMSAKINETQYQYYDTLLQFRNFCTPSLLKSKCNGYDISHIEKSTCSQVIGISFSVDASNVVHASSILSLELKNGLPSLTLPVPLIQKNTDAT